MSDSTELAVIQQPATGLAAFAPRVQVYAGASRSENTLRGYRSDWADFERWCSGNSFLALPASTETVASYLVTLADAGLKAGTIQRRISAIAANHTANGFNNPATSAVVKLTVAGIRRTVGTNQTGKTPVLTSDIASMLAHVPDSLIGVRDRALLLIGFAGAFRRSELVALDVADLDFTTEGVRITIRRSKTDQDGAGQTVAIAFGGALCPVSALRTWLTTAEIVQGPVFVSIRRYGHIQRDRLTPQVVASVVKHYCEAAGLDPAKYAGHSLRAGLVTQAAINGVQERVIMRQTRHKSSDMLRRYIRDANLFRDNASARVGL